MPRRYCQMTWSSVHLIGFWLMSVSQVCAQMGTGWFETTEREEARQKIQLENFKDPSGDNTPFNWPQMIVAVDKSGMPVEPDSPEATATYSWDPATKTHFFRLVKFPGNRSEIRVRDNYRTGARQFEGYLTMNENLDQQAVFQLFGSSTGATQMQIRGFGRRNGGELQVVFDSSMSSSGNSVIATGITGKEIRLNVIHLQEDVGNAVIVYINGQEKFRFTDGETLKNGEPFDNYFKYGVYGREKEGEFDGVTNMRTQWRAVRLWEGGKAP